MDNFGLKGNFKIVKISPDGTREVREFPNVVTNDGKKTLAGLIPIDVSAGSRFDYLAIGIGSTTPSATQTALVSEVYGRIDAVGTATGSQASFNGSFAITGAVDVTEYAVFNSSTNGSMLCRGSAAVTSAVSGDFVEVTYNITAG